MRKTQTPVKPSIIESPTATITGLITGLFALLVAGGFDVPWLLVAAGIIVPCGIVSVISPRWANDRGVFFRRPALFTAAFSYLVIFFAGLFGANIDQSMIYLIIGTVTTIVGFIFPKNGNMEWFLALFGTDDQ